MELTCQLGNLELDIYILSIQMMQWLKLSELAENVVLKKAHGI